MKVVKPTNNPLTGGYTNSHKGYDFAGLNLPDEVRAGMDGVVSQRVDLYNTSWINAGTLTTRDYGNYLLIKHDDGTVELHAHLKQGSSVPLGSRVSAGQIVARIGNTGNSSGPHLHSEYRLSGNLNTPVEFITLPPTTEDRRPYWFDLINDGVWKIPHEKITDEMVKDFSRNYIGRLKRSGLWDQVCQRAGIQGDTNIVSVDQVVNALQSQNATELAKKLKECQDKVVLLTKRLQDINSLSSL